MENFQKSEEIITIIDQLPVTENEDITVELLSIEPTPLKPKEEDAEKEKKEGTLKWLLQLKPLEKKTIQFKYSGQLSKKAERVQPRVKSSSKPILFSTSLRPECQQDDPLLLQFGADGVGQGEILFPGGLFHAG